MSDPTDADVATVAADLRAALPPGKLWNLRAGGVFVRFLEGLAVELARVELDGRALRTEFDPRSVYLLLADWERAFGIPGECGVLGTTIEARRQTLTAKVRAQPGGQSAAYFVGVAAAMGWAIEIEEHVPPGVGFPTEWGAGRGIPGLGWTNAWTVHAPPCSVDYFSAEVSGPPDPLVTSNLRSLLECTLRRIAPAHTRVVFEYDLPPAHEWGPWEKIIPPAARAVARMAAPVTYNPL